MIAYPIKYTDFNGVEREEAPWFHISQSELIDMELNSNDKFSTKLKALTNTENMSSIVPFLKDLLIKSYGEKTEDGKYFVKKDNNGRPLYEKFQQSEAYDAIFSELIQNPDKASEFIIGILPSKLAEEARKNVNAAITMTPTQSLVENT